MRGTMSLRKKIAILTMASMTVWGVTALLPFNQGRIVGNVGYAAEITPEKQVSMDYKTSGGTTAQTTGDLYYAFIDSTNSWWGHAGQIFVTDSGSIGTATAPLALYGQVLGGQYNTASGNYSVVLGGSGNTVSGVYSVVREKLHCCKWFHQYGFRGKCVYYGRKYQYSKRHQQYNHWRLK